MAAGRTGLVLPVLAAVSLVAGCAGGTASRDEPNAHAASTPAGPTDLTPGRQPPGSGRPRELDGTVSHVVDGDTIKVVARGFETTVRLVGIDTPETRRPGGTVQCFGRSASDRTKRLLPAGDSVRLVTDPTQDLRDRYGRLLAYVYKPGRSGIESVNYALVATGYAKVFIFHGVPFRYADAFRKAERAARRRGLGLWGPPCGGDATQSERSAGPPATPAPAPLLTPPTAPATASGRCDPSYRGLCVPPYPPDVDCAGLTGSVRVVGSDPHRLDRDGDGVACE